MVLQGETVGDKKITQIRCDCGKVMELGVHKSGAGYYIGFVCYFDGPYSRKSGYYPSREQAEYALENKEYGR